MTRKMTATLLLLVPVLQAALARYAWIYRSILESVALTLKNNYDNMRN
ncbi:carbohydrate kinase, partial [Escherichia coli]|nr:carbohydrate kinase [Escherichia coli]